MADQQSPTSLRPGAADFMDQHVRRISALKQLLQTLFQLQQKGSCHPTGEGKSKCILGHKMLETFKKL